MAINLKELISEVSVHRQSGVSQSLQQGTMEIEVALPTLVASTFSYRSEVALQKGVRVLVPFSGRRLIGVVIDAREELGESSAASRSYTLKDILSVIDEEPSYSPAMLSLAQWMSTYYCHPLGEVLRAMMPASVSRRKVEYWQQADSTLSAPVFEAAFLDELFSERQSLTEKRLLQKLNRLDYLQFAETPAEALRYFARQGLIKKHRSTLSSAKVASQSKAKKQAKSPRTQARQLSAQQQVVFDKICADGIAPMIRGERPKPFLLRGVTGSGKTEIYLQTIEKTLLEAGPTAQALVLVPEIALTPQMTDIFVNRFGEMVTVVHSAMPDQERLRHLDRIRRGEALILIGPRSAVFGPFRNLRLIIVDEEHDSSYKQHSGLMYHGRDVAILRAHMEKSLIILGSATPSLETYHHAKESKYQYVELPARIGGLPLPEIYCVESSLTKKRTGTRIGANLEEVEVPISDSILTALRENIAKGEQSIVLVNRRGFAHYLFSLKDRKAVSCPNCSISLTLHRRSTVLRCHYCDYRVAVAKILEKEQQQDFVSVGFGSERVEQGLARELVGARIARLDADTVSDRELLPKVLDEFRSGQIDILVGTQILAKGHDFPNVTLMVILEIDQLLDLPDFRAAERSFQLIVQAAGRAGRADKPGRVFMQSGRLKDATVQLALAQDFQAFAARELENRKLLKYPPFTRQVLIEISSTDEAELQAMEHRMVKWLEELARLDPELPQFVRVLGPSIPAIEMLRGRHRRAVLLSSSRADALKKLTKAFADTYAKLSGDLRMKIDVDPQSMV